MQPEQRKGIFAIAVVVGFALLLGGRALPRMQESESALTAEIRAALNGDTEAASKYASLCAGMASAIDSPKLKTTDDAVKATERAREALGQEHVEAFGPLLRREFACLNPEKIEPLTPELRRQAAAEFRRCETAFRAASRQNAPQSVSDVLRQFADRMEARK